MVNATTSTVGNNGALYLLDRLVVFTTYCNVPLKSYCAITFSVKTRLIDGVITLVNISFLKIFLLKIRIYEPYWAADLPNLLPISF